MALWQNLKLITLQKMFSADGTSIPNDSSTRDYIAAMPAAANEALQLLSTAGKFKIKYIDIAHIPVENLITGGDHVYKQIRGTMAFSAIGVRSLTFAYHGEGTYTILVDGVVSKTADLEQKSGYTTIKELVENPNDKEVVLSITSDYPISVMNIGMYAANYKTADAIMPYSEKVRYDLRALTGDFYMLSNEGIVFEGDRDISRYKSTDDYLQEGGKVLVLDRSISGNFRVYYKAYPQAITVDTPDDTELEIDDEVAAIMPLYMASQLYKEDDISIATNYRNEFEVAFSQLKDSAKAPNSEVLTSTSGWI